MNTDQALHKSIAKFHALKNLAHEYDIDLDRRNIDDHKELANQLFTKSCLTLEAIDRTISTDKDFNLHNFSTLWTFSRILLEEYITLEYLFDSKIQDDELQLRIDLYRYHGVVEEYDLLKAISSEDENNLEDQEFNKIRQGEYKKIEDEIERCKNNIAKNSFIDCIPKDNDHYSKEMIIKGKASKYIKSKKLINDIFKRKQTYGTYKLGSSFIHSSYYSLEQLKNLAYNIHNNDLSKLCICLDLLRGCTTRLIKKYIEIFKLKVDYKLLSSLASFD